MSDINFFSFLFDQIYKHLIVIIMVVIIIVICIIRKNKIPKIMLPLFLGKTILISIVYFALTLIAFLIIPLIQTFATSSLPKFTENSIKALVLLVFAISVASLMFFMMSSTFEYPSIGNFLKTKVFNNHLKIKVKKLRLCLNLLLFSLIILLPIFFSSYNYFILLFFLIIVFLLYYLFNIWIINSYQNSYLPIVEIKNLKKVYETKLGNKLTDLFSKYLLNIVGGFSLKQSMTISLLLNFLTFLCLIFGILPHRNSSLYLTFFIIGSFFNFLFTLLSNLSKLFPFDLFISNLPITNINIDSSSLSKYPMFFSSENSNNKGTIMLNINLKEFLSTFVDELEANEEIQVNLDHYTGLCKQSVSLKDPYIHVLLNLSLKKESELFDLNFHFSNKLKNRYSYHEISILIENQGGVIIPSYCFQTRAKLYNFKNSSILDSINSHFNYLPDVDVEIDILKKINEAISNSYYFNNIDVPIDLKEGVSVSQKIILNPNKFGDGKTTYDTLNCSHQEFTPVLISPWESNYDHDILYLIYSSLEDKAVYKNSNSYNKGNFLIFTLMAATSTFLAKPLSYLVIPFADLLYDSFHNILEMLNLTTVQKLFKATSADNGAYIAAVIIISFTIWVLRKNIMGQLIIFKKNYTKIHKEYYIDGIINLLNRNPRTILIIEDIDRLEAEVQLETFRILSLINSRLPKYYRIFCIVSYDTELIKKTLSGSSTNYDDIDNKLIYSTWGDKFDTSESILLYFENSLRTFIKTLPSLSDSSSNEELIQKCKSIIKKEINCSKNNQCFLSSKPKKQSIHQFNFRTIRTVIEKLKEVAPNEIINSKESKTLDYLLQEVLNKIKKNQRLKTH